ncbi:MAG: Serine phosphatase RsbU, regulator of sigma subunit [uncultured Chloroflexi bacterium]|uniref:Serine phosphatase RsbU, regulator of sigma subunit n=1 Tax=uncultured Chloroflexota bacterium TaxID=166587 RepID=A0A6J4IZ43_9CHLR|nr:MAG: Serine phosphatase RsbU, regulator of sigma subunit [uncultured Chloroflexota bacterium]
MLTYLGFAPTWWLCRGALAPYRLVLAPLVGWSLLTAACYWLLPVLTFGPALAIVALAAGGANLYLLMRLGIGGHRRRRPAAPVRALVLAMVAVGVLLVTLLPHLLQGSLALLIPNQDDEFFVEVVDGFWAHTAGWRTGAGSFRIETGWAYHVLLAVLRLFPWLDEFEAVPLGGYIALALGAPAVSLVFHRTLRLPWLWAVAGGGLAQLHGLVLWTPGYGFGPNVAAIAATPFAVLALCRAMFLRDVRSLVLAGLALGLVLMSYTKVAVLLAAFGGAGLAVALLCAPGSAARRCALAVRLAVAGLVGLVAGGYAVFDAVAWGFQSMGRLLFDVSETAGAGWGWTDFPPLAVWLGAGQWSLIGTTPLQSAPFATAAAALCGAGLLATCRRHNWPLAGTLLGCVLFFIYARYLKSFPYAVFKLYTITAFLGVGLCLSGALTLPLQLRRWAARWPRLAPVGSPLAAFALAAALAVPYAASYLAGSMLAQGFYLQPWEPLLRPGELAEIDAVARRVAPGSSVWLTGATRVLLDPAHAAVRAHPIGFHTLGDAEGYGGARLQAALHHTIKRNGSRPVGLFDRTDAATSVWPDRVDYIVTPAGGDPWLHGVTGARVAGGATFALYTNPSGVLPPMDTATLDTRVQPGQPVRVALDCAGMVAPVAVGAPDAAAPAAACDGADRTLTLGLVTSKAGPVTLDIEAFGGGVRRTPLYLQAGLTWHTTPHVQAPLRVTLASAAQGSPDEHPRLYVASAALSAVPAGTAAGAANAAPGTRPTAGVRWQTEPIVVTSVQSHRDAFTVEAVYATQTPLREDRFSLINGESRAETVYATDADLGRTLQVWRWEITPGQPPRQFIDDREVPIAHAGAWPPGHGPHWLRFRISRSDDVRHEASIGYVDLGRPQGNVQLLRTKVAIPLRAAAQRPALPPPGTLLKGSADYIFWAADGELRWVPDLDVFTRRGFRWETVQTVSDDVLARWPMGLPLD